MKKNRALEILKNISKVLVTLGALYWVIRNIRNNKDISLEELENELMNCDWTILFLAFCAYAASQLMASWRLNSFFKVIKLNLTERYNFRLYQLGLLYNFFLPGGIGGDGYKIYFLKKEHHVRGRKILSAVFFDRLSGLWALCIITCALIIFMPRLAIPNYITISASLLGTLSYYFILHTYFKDFSKKFFITHIKALGVQGFQVLSAILILYSLDFQDKFSPYLLLFLVSSLVSIVPSIGGGAGLRELVMMYGAMYLKIDIHSALLLSIFFYVISLLMASSGIYYVIRPERLGAKKLPSVAEVEEEIVKEKEDYD